MLAIFILLLILLQSEVKLAQVKQIRSFIYTNCTQSQSRLVVNKKVKKEQTQ